MKVKTAVQIKERHRLASIFLILFHSVQPLSCSPSQSEPGPGLWTCGPACQRIPCIWTFLWTGWLPASRFWNRLLVSTNGLVCELSRCCQASVPCCYQPWLLTIHLWRLFSFSAQTANLQCSDLTASHKLLVLPLLTSATNLDFITNAQTGSASADVTMRLIKNLFWRNRFFFSVIQCHSMSFNV